MTSGPAVFLWIGGWVSGWVGEWVAGALQTYHVQLTVHCTRSTAELRVLRLSRYFSTC